MKDLISAHFEFPQVFYLYSSTLQTWGNVIFNLRGVCSRLFLKRHCRHSHSTRCWNNYNDMFTVIIPDPRSHENTDLYNNEWL